MKWSARKLVLAGVGFGVVASGAAALWLPERSHTPARAGHHAGGPTQGATPHDLTALQAEVARVQDELQSNLRSLHSQLARMDRDQDATSYKLNQLTDQLGRVEGADAQEAEAAALTPEEGRARAEARLQAELALLDGTLRAERPDPAWASTAQQTLYDTFHPEALPGVHLLGAECRTTLCRMELALDDASQPDSYRGLLHLAPWSGPSFIQINTETGETVMYLAREAHSLPQLQE